MTDDQTMAYYDAHAAVYGNVEPDPEGSFVAYRERFAERLGPASSVLDLGCGGGHDSFAFLENGFDVVAYDGSVELAAIASARTGLDVIVADFSELSFNAEFDGVWAAASLTHVPQEALRGVLEKTLTSLRIGGLLVASFKCAEQAWRDEQGRYFSAMDAPGLTQIATKAGFAVESVDLVPARQPQRAGLVWAWLTARRP